MKRLRGPDGRFVAESALIAVWMPVILDLEDPVASVERCIEALDRFLILAERDALKRAADNIDIPEIFMGQSEMPFPISYGILNAKRLERMRKVLLEAQGQLAGASQL